MKHLGDLKQKPFGPHALCTRNLLCHKPFALFTCLSHFYSKACRRKTVTHNNALYRLSLIPRTCSQQQPFTPKTADTRAHLCYKPFHNRSFALDTFCTEKNHSTIFEIKKFCLLRQKLETTLHQRASKTKKNLYASVQQWAVFSIAMQEG